jgi:hypothetical protein
MIVMLSRGSGMNILMAVAQLPPIVASVVLVALARGFPAFRVIFYFIRS